MIVSLSLESMHAPARKFLATFVFHQRPICLLLLMFSAFQSLDSGTTISNSCFLLPSYFPHPATERSAAM